MRKLIAAINITLDGFAVATMIAVDEIHEHSDLKVAVDG